VVSTWGASAGSSTPIFFSASLTCNNALDLRNDMAASAPETSKMPVSGSCSDESRPHQHTAQPSATTNLGDLGIV